MTGPGPDAGTPPTADAGNALVEFVYLAVLLMVPLVYVLLTVFRVQGAAYAVSAAAREAGRVYVIGGALEDGDGARDRALAAARLVLDDSGLDVHTDHLTFNCSADPCLTPGATIEVGVSVAVRLPFLPDFLAGGAPAAVNVSGRHLEVVDRYRQIR